MFLQLQVDSLRDENYELCTTAINTIRVCVTSKNLMFSRNVRSSEFTQYSWADIWKSPFNGEFLTSTGMSVYIHINSNLMSP